MIEEIRELLKKIDKIVDSETKRLYDEIESLKQQILAKDNKRQNEIEFKAIIKTLEGDLGYSKKEIQILQNKLEKCKESLHKRIKELQTQNKEFKQELEVLKSKLEGYKFTVNVISKWIPSQKENIDVLIALSTAPKHVATIDYLHSFTKIAKVTLRNHILPILIEKGLIYVKEDKVRLVLEIK